MKLFAFIVVVLAIAAGVRCLDYYPLDVPSYCAPIENGIFSDPAGNLLNISQVYVSTALYINGQNNPGPLSTAAFWGSEYPIRFFSVGNYNTTEIDFPNGTVWDFFVYPDYAGVVADGTYDTFDDAMVLVVDGDTQYPVVPTTVTCNTDSYGFAVQAESANGLKITRSFYVPQGPVESWARVVDVISNPTDSDILSNIGYLNEMGSDSGTIFYAITDRYTVSGDAFVTELLEDNPASIHFHGVQAKLSAVSEWLNSAPMNTSDKINPTWNITIPAGKTVSLMLVINQGGMSIEKTLEVAAEIDANPLKLYYGMTGEQLSTVQNFNPCAATLPSLTLTSQAECTTKGGSATYSVALGELANSGFKVVATNSDSGSSVTVSGNTISLSEGTHSFKLEYGACSASLSSVTVSCPATSSASILAASGALSALMLLA